MNEEEKLKLITEFLEKGCTMLATHHDCGAPLFRCKGKILCPVCSSTSTESGNMPVGPNMTGSPKDLGIKASSKVEAGSEEASGSSEDHFQSPGQENSINEHLRSTHAALGPERSPQSSEASSLVSELEMTKQSIEMAVLFRLRDLASNIKDEKDLGRLRSQLDCVEASLRVICALNL